MRARFHTIFLALVRVYARTCPYANRKAYGTFRVKLNDRKILNPRDSARCAVYIVAMISELTLPKRGFGESKV